MSRIQMKQTVFDHKGKFLGSDVLDEHLDAKIAFETLYKHMFAGNVVVFSRSTVDMENANAEELIDAVNKDEPKAEETSGD